MKIILLLTLIICVTTSYSQIDNRRVIASAGKIAKKITPTLFGTSYIMSYTVGEPFIYVGTLVGNSTTRMYNGFQQPNVHNPVGPGVVVAMPTLPIFKIYPNPFDHYSIIEVPKEYEEQELKLQLIDANGKLIFEDFMKGARHKADYTTGILPGAYFLNIYQSNGEFIQQVKLIKTHEK